MNLIFFDDPKLRAQLLPFTYTRPLCDLRIGILTIREKWEKIFEIKSSTITENYLSEKYALRLEEDNLLINGALLPSEKILYEISALKPGQVLKQGDCFLAAHVEKKFLQEYSLNSKMNFTDVVSSKASPVLIDRPWLIFSKNSEAIGFDFAMQTKGRKSGTLSSTNQVIGNSNLVFIEEGAKIECSILNTKEGAIYIGKNAEVMEGCLLRGPIALCEGAVVKMGTKIYGPSTIGPYSKVGGEINNSVLFANSNKAHDGFLGNSVIGEWCNLGADTNTSNLKNNYSSVKVWDFQSSEFVDTGLQFCGLMMGDHSKCSINTMFNTGTVVGMNANIFGFGFPAKFIPSFSWDGAGEPATYNFEQACDVASKVMERRGQKFSEVDKKILRVVFEASSRFRHWEKK